MQKLLFGLIFGGLLFLGTPFAFADFDTLVVLETNSGNITIEFFPEDAPKHVENFITLTESGFYDNTIFHRVIKDFMIQGGDPKTYPDSGYPKSQWGTGGPSSFLDAEFNTIKHNHGVVSMARSADPNSAGSQFFIVHKDSNFLDQQYTVFGRIVTEESFTTLEKIASAETGADDVPLNIEDVRIIKTKTVNRSQISDLLNLPEPERVGSSINSNIIPSDGEQVFESKELGIKFTVPQGWLLQQPTKTNTESPDVVATGPQTGQLPSAITLNIKETNGKPFLQIVQEKLDTLKPMIEDGILQVENSNPSGNIGELNGRETHEITLEAFVTMGEKEFSVGFREIMIHSGAQDKIYTFGLMNDDFTAFVEQIEILDNTTESFQITTPTQFQATQAKDVFDLPEDTEQGGGCLIATAAYGSEMAPQVQFLREIRDNTVLQTQSGTAFMTGFNQFYYSFSPAMADYERENPVFKEAVKLSLTPLLTSLAILNYVDIDTEQEMLGYGIGVILLNIGMYFVAPAAVIIAIKNRRK